MKLTQSRIITITIMLIGLACFAAVYLGLFTQRDLWFQTFAAVLGVIITAIITMILLKGQSDNDIRQAKTSKVFEEKLRIYQEYLQTLYRVIKDGSLSDAEKIELEFQTSYVAMHCTPCYIASVSSAVKKIIEYTCSENELKEINAGKSNTPEPLLENLFCVVEAFRKDLYDNDNFNFDSEYKRVTLLNFSEAYRNAKDGNNNQPDTRQHILVDLNMLSNKTSVPVSIANDVAPSNEVQLSQTVKEINRELWDNAIQRWESMGWTSNDWLSEKDCFQITNKDGNPGVIDFGFYDGHYYVQAGYCDDTDFSKPLKWEKGGRRSKGLWWQYLDEPYFGIKENEFLEKFNSSQDLQKYIIEHIEELRDLLVRHHRTTEWKEKIMAHKDWKTFIWYWDMLACEYNNESDGIPYLDIIEKDNSGIVLIHFANRQCDANKLQETLKQIGCANKVIQENGYVVLDEIPSVEANKVAERVNYWIDKISH